MAIDTIFSTVPDSPADAAAKRAARDQQRAAERAAHQRSIDLGSSRTEGNNDRAESFVPRDRPTPTAGEGDRQQAQTASGATQTQTLERPVLVEVIPPPRIDPERDATVQLAQTDIAPPLTFQDSRAFEFAAQQGPATGTAQRIDPNASIAPEIAPPIAAASTELVVRPRRALEAEEPYVQPLQVDGEVTYVRDEVVGRMPAEPTAEQPQAQPQASRSQSRPAGRSSRPNAARPRTPVQNPYAFVPSENSFTPTFTPTFAPARPRPAAQRASQNVSASIPAQTPDSPIAERVQPSARPTLLQRLREAIRNFIYGTPVSLQPANGPRLENVIEREQKRQAEERAAARAQARAQARSQTRTRTTTLTTSRLVKIEVDNIDLTVVVETNTRMTTPEVTGPPGFHFEQKNGVWTVTGSGVNMPGVQPGERTKATIHLPAGTKMADLKIHGGSASIQGVEVAQVRSVDAEVEVQEARAVHASTNRGSLSVEGTEMKHIGVHATDTQVALGGVVQSTPDLQLNSGSSLADGGLVNPRGESMSQSQSQDTGLRTAWGLAG